MRLMRSFYLIIGAIFMLISSMSFAQDNGFIRGQVYDESGLTLPGARVIVIGQGTGAKTDLDGNFSISIAPGTYALQISSLAKDTLKITDIDVKAGDATVVPNLVMFEKSITTNTVVVTAERKDNTDNAVLTLKKTSTNSIDVMSSETMRKTGDSDAGAVMKRIPGVSIAGGKYVYVRGLGDRYNKTVLNGMDIPGLDPDKNTLQLDIFPTNILDNIIVNKSFIAELPADFTGGIVDIGLKSFPDRKRRSFSVGLGFNPAMHFQSDYLTYDGGKLDFLGIDDGTRKIPTDGYSDAQIPQFVDAISDPDEAAVYGDILSKFDPTMAAMEKMSLMDMSLSLSFGDQFKKEDSKYRIGYNFIASYSNQTEFYRDAVFANYLLSPDQSATELDSGNYQVGNYGTNNTLLTGMAGIAFKSAQSKYVFNVLHIQNGESRAGQYDFYNYAVGSTFLGEQTNLTYTQRSMTNVFIGGKHDFYEKEKGWKFEWRVAPTLSIQDDPDIRFTRYEIRGDSTLIGTEAGFPVRIWRDLREISANNKLDWTKEYKLWDRKANLKFGTAYTFKMRNYEIRNFQLNPRNVPTTGDPDELLSEELLWPYNGNTFEGTTFEAQFLPTNPNKFDSDAHTAGVYISTEVSPATRLKLTLGFRSEYYVQFYEGQNQTGSIVLSKDPAPSNLAPGVDWRSAKVLENLGWFPSLNLIYNITDKQNLRVSYGKTIARPSFKEMSYAEIFDPITGRTFVGGLFSDINTSGADSIVYWDGNLTSTDIHNFDLRWEMYHKPGQTVAITAFYKMFFNPIEIVQYTIQPGAFQPRNVGDGTVLGGELEVRQGLDIFGEKMKNFTFSLNVTYTYSRIKFSETEKQSRDDNARAGETIGTHRDMAGQAPYLINAGFSYDGSLDKDAKFLKGFEIGAYYNVQGRTLQFVGIANRPDIYSVPFHSLNLTMNKRFGEKQQYRFGFKASNLLNDKKESVFYTHNTKEEFFQSLAPGFRFSFSFGMNF